MITNHIAHWRSTMNGGKGISRAHLARQIGVGRSFVTKLEKGTAQPGAELMLRAGRYFRQPVESVFELAVTGAGVSAVACRQAIPPSQITFTTTPAGPRCNAKAAPSARPAEPGATKDKSLVSPTAKAVAPPVAQASRKKK